MEGTATFSPCNRYRYDLTRRWGSGSPLVWLLLNPSTATAEINDQTIRKCIRFSELFGHEALVILNLFGYRATDPKVMRAASDPVGPDNDEFIRKHVFDTKQVICAWGAHGRHRDRDQQVLKQLRGRARLLCIHTIADGSPGHPLMLSYQKGLQSYQP